MLRDATLETEWPLDSSDAIERAVAQTLAGARDAQLRAMRALCAGLIDPGAAVAYVSQWLMRNHVYESTRRNAVAAHPDPAVLVRAVAQFEREEHGAQPPNAAAADIRARGRKIGGLFKIAARVVALDASFRNATNMLAAQAAQREAQVRQAEAGRRRLASLTPEQVMLTDMLAWQGFSTNDARALAVAYHDAHASRALPYACTWINYALAQTSLHSPVAFLRKRIETQDRPPATASVEGPAMDFWLWREDLLPAQPAPLEQPLAAYAMHQRQRAQLEAIERMAETDAALNVVAPEGEPPRTSPSASDAAQADEPMAVNEQDLDLARVFGPAARRALDLVQLRRWRDALVAAFARDDAWRAYLARVTVRSVDRDARRAVLTLRDATAIDAAIFALQGLSRLNEHAALQLAIDPAQADDALLDVLACWRDAVREYRAEFGALDNAPVDASTRLPISRIWPLSASDDRATLVMPALAPVSANAPACVWLSRRLAEMLGRAVRVVSSAQ